jgi:uncharacterized membrane protein HdeD (DUF308 family)
MEEKIMAIKIIGTLIGAMILGAGLYYLIKERNDKESRKVYGTISSIGGVIFVVMLTLTILALV